MKRQFRQAYVEPTSEQDELLHWKRAHWEEAQIQFVDDPSEAVGTADKLVTQLITELGYPTAEYDERLADLSVEHASTLEHYREAHEISERSATGLASTEDLRLALVHYRALFADLLGADPVSTTPGTTTSDPDDAPAPAPRRATGTDAATDTSR